MFKLYELLDTIQSILGHISVRLALEVISQLDKIGVPPSIADKDALRHWLQGLLPALSAVVEATPNEIDNHAVILVQAAIDDDEVWNALYGLLSSLASGWNVNAARGSKSAHVLSDRMGLDLDKIMEIVKLILKFIELLRK